MAPEQNGKDRSKLPRKDEEARALSDWMCANSWAIRTFGAVMSTGVNAG